MNFIRFLLASVAVFTWATLIWANTDVPSSYPTIGKINKMDDRLDALIDPDAAIEVIASGFVWTEGPAWNKQGSYLVFSDIPRNVVMKWSESEGFEHINEAIRIHGY